MNGPAGRSFRATDAPKTLLNLRPPGFHVAWPAETGTAAGLTIYSRALFQAELPRATRDENQTWEAE